MIDVSKIPGVVQRALAEAGSSPWLYGYDVVGIQAFIVGRSRPIAMRGASETVIDFDRGSGMNIFKGGGRGIGLIGSEAAAMQRSKELTARYRACGGVLVTAAVPYQKDRPDQSLAWLRAKLELAKDSAAPPPGQLPTDKATQCTNCQAYMATLSIGRDGATKEQVCELCAAVIQKGRETGEMSRSLGELSPSHTIAAVSADGNGLGAFFDSLKNLEQTAAASEAISQIFREAHDAALKELTYKCVPLVTGGDDIRAFMAAEDLLVYAESLVRHVEVLANRAGDLGGILSRDAAERLARLGVGVGAVVADDHHPASRLMEYAHQLEDSAKTICRLGLSDKNQRPARSAFDFAVMTSVDSFSEGAPRRGEADGRPFAMEAANWDRLMRSAKALARVPSTQLGILAESRTLSGPEYLNLFRYQVARIPEWQAFFKQSDIDWCDSKMLDAHLPGSGLLDLLRLLGRPS